jgi:hypothetical protein
MSAQLGAESVQIVLCGAPISRSSSAPTRTATYRGSSASYAKSGVPQVGQNRWRIMRPLSALRA